MEELISKLDEVKDMLYDSHESEKYDIDLHQMGEDIENMIKQLKETA